MTARYILAYKDNLSEDHLVYGLNAIFGHQNTRMDFRERSKFFGALFSDCQDY